jgi:hypothetical protein
MRPALFCAVALTAGFGRIAGQSDYLMNKTGIM